MIEVITRMLSETEFYDSRNEFLQEEKCRYLWYLFKSITGKPELPVQIDRLYDDRSFDLSQQVK